MVAKSMKVLARLLLALLLLFVAVLGLAWYLLGTQSGFRQLPKLVSTFTPYSLEYGALQGHLFTKQHWKDLRLTGEDLAVYIEDLQLQVSPKALWYKRVRLDSLKLDGAEIKLSGQQKQSDAQTGFDGLAQIDLPVKVDIEEVSLANVRIWQDDEALIYLDKATLEAHFANQQLTFEAQAALTQLRSSMNLKAQLAGKVKTAGAYPLDVQGEALVQMPEDVSQEVVFSLQQSLLSPELVINAKGMLDAQMTLSGDIDAKAQQLALIGQWQALDYQGQYQSAQGQITLEGGLDDLAVELQTQATGEHLPPIALSAHAVVKASSQAVREIDLTAKVLGGEVRFTGEVDYGARLAWRGALAVEDVVAQRYYEDITGEIDALITTQGAQVGDRLEAHLDIERLEGQWQGEPVQGQGQVRYDNGEILVDEFALTLAGNVVQANGKVVGQALDLALQVDAGHLGRLLPEAQGAVKGAVKLEGTLDNPAVAADLQWKDLAYQQTTAEADNKAMAFRSNKGQLRVNGRLNEGLDVALDADVAGSDIPEGEVVLTAKVQRDKVQAIDLSLNTLGGSIHAQGNVALTPEVAWDIEAQVNQVDVGDYVQQVDGVVSAKVRSQGSLANNQVNMQTQLTELSGQWQGMPLSGQAEVKMQDGQLAIEGMNVAVGENHIDLKGDLNPEALDVSFDLQGENLSSFYPELGGRVSGQGRITGSAQSPNVAVTLSGNHIRYQNIAVASAKVSLNSAMRSGQPFNNEVVLSGVQVGDRRWEQVALSTQGTFDKHTLSLKTTGGEVDVLLAANGGFKAIDSWAGRINALEIQGYEMDWRLTSPMNLVFSPQQIKADNLCLADSYSNLCVDIEKAERTRLAYRIERLDARSFAPFIPDNMRIEPALMGSGEVSMAQNGVLSGQAALEFTKGALYFQPEDAAPVRLMLREGAVNAHFTQRQAQVNAAIDFVHAGSIRAQMAVSNWSNPVVEGRLAVNVPDISHFEHFVPKVSELGGKIAGELRFAGALPNPEVSGEIVFSQGVVKIPEYATDLQDIVLRLRALETGRIDIDGKLGTPEGDLQANGQLALSPLALDLHLQGARMLVANSEEIRAVVSPNITVAVDPDSGVKVSGEVVVDEANVSIPSRSEGVAISEDVVIVGLEDHPKDRQAPALKENSPLEVRVDIRLGDKVFFQASEVKLRLIGGLKVMVLPSQPVIGRGVIEVASGVYELYGQELDIKRGKITFTGNNIANPTVDVLATREVDKVNVGAQINGTVENLSLSLIADPSMPDSAILSYLLFGRAPDGAMDSEALLQTAASLSLGQIFPSNLAEQTGLDVFDLGVTGLKAGKYLGEDLYVGMRSNFFTAVTEFVARYQFNKRLSVEATAKQNENAVDFLYEFEK